MQISKFHELEAKGEAQVLKEVATGIHGDHGSAAREDVNVWLKLKELERDNSRASSSAEISASNLESRRLEITILRKANKLKIIDIVLSTITAITAVIIGALLAYWLKP